MSSVGSRHDDDFIAVSKQSSEKTLERQMAQNNLILSISDNHLVSIEKRRERSVATILDNDAYRSVWVPADKTPARVITLNWFEEQTLNLVIVIEADNNQQGVYLVDQSILQTTVPKV